MIKVTDYIIKELEIYGIKHVFMISGGGAMHLVDSVGKSKKIKYICPHHEQAAAMAAEGYSRVSGKMGVVVVTSGPGGTNTLTGVIGQWLDSIPCLYLSGQIKQETCIATYPELKLRQLGDQEINIVDIVRPVTKYAVMVKDPKTIRYHLKKAIYLATHGRPGPVWLDIPLDIQGAIINESDLREYNENEDTTKIDPEELISQVKLAINELKKSKRPIILAGNAIRISGAKDLFTKISKKIGIPIVTSFNGFDLMETDEPLFVGRIGTIGDRAGNFALQNSDLLLSIGSRNNIRQVSYNWQSYARGAKKIFVDIDKAELSKPTVKPDIAINQDVADFLKEFNAQIQNIKLPGWKDWKEWCARRKEKYPVVIPQYTKAKGRVNPYHFMQSLSSSLKENAVVVTGNGTASVVYFQAGIVKRDQRVIWNSGCASMGYDLPAAIGACFANGKKDVICLAGDGSLMMNIQELQTVFSHKLPIKLFILNNSGYVSIKQTQDTFFNGHHVASDTKSGVTFPDIIKVAKAYGLKTDLIDANSKVKAKLSAILKTKGPVVCEVILPPYYNFSPKLSSERKSDGTIISKPLEDMWPFLPRDEFKKNMIIPERNPE
jgi:acetolactate synthase-1/2/3 large subunit